MINCSSYFQKKTDKEARFERPVLPTERRIARRAVRATALSSAAARGCKARGPDFAPGNFDVEITRKAGGLEFRLTDIIQFFEANDGEIAENRVKSR